MPNSPQDQDIQNVIPRSPGGARTVEGSSRRGHQMRRTSMLLLWAITLFFVGMFFWISIAEVDTVSRADGRVMPSAKMQVVQNLEGGIVSAILVKQGQTVNAGDRLVALSAVQADSDQRARHQQIVSLEARAAKLVALADGQQPKFPKSVSDAAPDLVAAELASFLSKKLEQESQVSVLTAQMEQKNRESDEARITLKAAQEGLVLAREERATVARLVERGLEPRLELVRLDRALAEQQGRADVTLVSIDRIRSAINEMVARRDSVVRQFRSEALSELNRTLAELSPLRQGVPALADRLARTEIRAPMKGIVNRVFVNTVGGIVKPGEPILEVVPADDQLVIDAMVNPKDIGFIKLGQPARVKITAYDYSIFGAMNGTVQNISADAVPNEKGEAFYMVRIETDTRAIEVLDKKLPIQPGMQAQVDIVTGKKTILQFLSKPLIGVKENAFRER